MTPPPAQTLRTRAYAAQVLAQWFQSGEFPDRQIETAHPPHRGMVMELVYGCVRRQRQLDFCIGRLTSRPPDPVVRAVLQVGLYQLFHMDRTEAYAAVHETVEAARALGRPQAAPLVNAVLRRAQREQAALDASLARQPLAVRASHPDDVVARWRREWGEEQTEALCAWNNRRARVCLRPVPSVCAFADYAARLRDAGLEATPHPFDPDRFLLLPHGIRVQDLPGYTEGAFVVQDPATAPAIDLLDVRPGLRVLDACAAPGGKTLLIADQMSTANGEMEGLLVAADLHEDRLQTLRANLQRMQRPHVQVHKFDVANLQATRQFRKAVAPAGFDRILLDVPCSNSGVIQRRPDARYRLTPDRLKALVQTQQDMLTAAACLLVPGGRMVYSTCSLEAEENGDGMRAWLKRNPRMRMEVERALFPPTTQTDGAYAAALVSAADSRS